MRHDGYRIDAPRPRRRSREMQDTVTPGSIVIHSGETADLAIPCFYQEIHRPIPVRPHDRLRHDTLGWPTPDRPDHSCQEWDFDRHVCRRTPHMKCDPPHCERYVDMGSLFPIHLREEGYKTVNVVLQSDIVEATAHIDEVQDWVIRLGVSSVPDVEMVAPSHTSLALYLVDDAKSSRGAEFPSGDLVALMKVTVLPIAIPYATEA